MSTEIVYAVMTPSCSSLLMQVMADNLTVRQIREIKSAIAKDELEGATYSADDGGRPVRIAKKATLTLRITLSRLDNLIDEVHTTVGPDQRAEIVSMLMGMRIQVHSMIDQSIRFKNSQKT